MVEWHQSRLNWSNINMLDWATSNFEGSTLLNTPNILH